MGLSANTTLAYSGYADVEIKIGDISLYSYNHNQGTENLFKMLAKALQGYDSSDEQPTTLDIIKTDEPMKSILDSPIQLTGSKFFKQQQNWVQQYSQVVTQQNISQDIPDDDQPQQGSQTGYYLTLKNVYGNQLAKLDILYMQSGQGAKNPLQYIKSNQGTTMIITWTMTVNNIER